MRDKSVSTVERRFAADCVAAGHRIDGRAPTDARRVAVSLGPTWGFTEVSFDQTHAIASTTIEPLTPSPDRPAEGTLTISMDLSPTSSEPAARDALQRTAPNPAVTEARTSIDKFVRESRALDTEALCILAGVKVWAVRVHVDLINDDGNCVDVCVMAVMASLMHARRPDVTVTGREVRVHPLDEREPVPLPVHHVPLAVSFALFGAGKPYEPDTVVLDPVKNEEVASAGALSIAYNSQGEVCGVYKAGGLPLRPETFLECSSLAAARALKLAAILKKALADSAVQHPLATVRPMLVKPEPVAQLKSNKKAEGKMTADVSQVGSMWNATPMEDVAPPPAITDNLAVQMNEVAVDGVEEAVDSIFEKKEEEIAAPMMEEKVDKEAEKRAIVKSIVMSDEESDDSSEDDDDLENAIISRPRGRGGRH